MSTLPSTCTEVTHCVVIPPSPDKRCKNLAFDVKSLQSRTGISFTISYVFSVESGSDMNMSNSTACRYYFETRIDHINTNLPGDSCSVL